MIIDERADLADFFFFVELLEPPPQERVLRHTVKQIADACLFVQILNALVPQTGEQLVSFFKFLDTQMPVEQVIAVPKITKDMIQPRLVDYDLRQPQMLFFLKQRVLEQIVDIPVPRGRWSSGGGGLHVAVLKVMEDPVGVSPS